VPTRIRNVTQQIGARRVLEQRALRPLHTQMQFAMALMRLSGNKPVKMAVHWKGRRATLTEKLFIDIATSFLTAHVAIDSNLSGGAPGQGGDVASLSMVDGLCAMADIVQITAQVICAAVFETGHSRRRSGSGLDPGAFKINTRHTPEDAVTSHASTAHGRHGQHGAGRGVRVSYRVKGGKRERKRGRRECVPCPRWSTHLFGLSRRAAEQLHSRSLT